MQKNVVPQQAAPKPWKSSDYGCPGAYVAGTAYAAGDVVSTKTAGMPYTRVFKCTGEPNNQFCGKSGYEPGIGLYSSNAWTELGNCVGSLAPTDSPNFDVLKGVGGCPLKYSSSGTYTEGDEVSKDGFVYVCNALPNGLYCPVAAYEPGVDSPGLGATPYWKTAWTIKGVCDGTKTPTSSPNFDVLPLVGGCPAKWELKVSPNKYEEADTVAVGNIVYRCKGWPQGGHCGQAGYEPGKDYPGMGQTPYWKDAWTVAGYCDGSMGPTSSPSFALKNIIGACPDDWEKRAHPLKYEEGDMVSVTVSKSPERKYAYTCKAYPWSGHCGNFAPDVFGGDQGWTLAGPCSGSLGPTASPQFVKLAAAPGPVGCPAEFNLSKMDYAYGDKVSIKLDADRAIVYQCKPWPDGDYCKSNSANIRNPGGEFGSMAWNLIGRCSGSMAPTPAPVAYNSGAMCTYTKTVVTTNCARGSAGCSCTANSPPGTYCTKTTTTTLNVPNYSAGSTYANNDVVRINGVDRFKCKVSGWCSNKAYSPDGALWSSAWSKDGTCAPSLQRYTEKDNTAITNEGLVSKVIGERAGQVGSIEMNTTKPEVSSNDNMSPLLFGLSAVL